MEKNYPLLSAILLIAFCMNTHAQNTFPATGSAGIGTTTPDASSLLEIKSTSQGLLIPRMSKAQRDLISSPAAGLLIYQNNSTPGFYYYSGTAWTAIKGANTTLSNLTAPTAVNQDLLPATNSLYSLGSSSQRWRYAYLASLNFNDGTTQNTAFQPYTPGTGISISGTAVSLVNSGVTAGSYGSSSKIPVITIDATGRITSATTATASGANTTLSNLSANTSINRSLVPNAPNVIDLGSGSLSWRDLYLGGKLYLGGERFMYKTSDASTFVGNNSGNLTATGTNNTAFGAASGAALTSGEENAFFGDSSGYANTSGSKNTFAGSGSGRHNSTGSENTYLGAYSGFDGDGDQNVAVGTEALHFSYGNLNTAIGYSALNGNFGTGNTAIGSRSLTGNSGSGNTATGQEALGYNTYGNANTATGGATLFNNRTGNDNTANGSNALELNISGSSNVAVGSSALFADNSSSNLVAVGDSALFNLMNGTQSVAVGSKAGFSTNGSSNSYLGYQAGYYDNASFNTAIGTKAGWTVANASGCTYLGSFAGPTTNGLTNTTGIGYNVTPTASNQVRVGNSSVSSIGGQVGWTTLSDGRFKRNIKENVPGLTFINLLKPVTYTIDIASLKKFKGEEAKEKGKKTANETSQQEKFLHTGFVAQDVEAVAKKLNYDFDGVDAPKNDKDPYGLRYAEFVVPLVKAVQELSKLNDEKDAKLERMQKQIDGLKAMILKGTQPSTPSETVIKTTLSSASLEQNLPNPFTNATTIRYTLPMQFGEAKMLVSDKTGKVLQTTPITGSSTGTILVNASTLASGAYQYSLIIDNMVVASRQMLHVK